MPEFAAIAASSRLLRSLSCHLIPVTSSLHTHTHSCWDLQLLSLLRFFFPPFLTFFPPFYRSDQSSYLTALSFRFHSFFYSSHLYNINSSLLP